MMLRPFVVSCFIFIFIIVGIYEIYVRSNTRHSIHFIKTPQSWIGVIDMDNDHDFSIEGILKGEDVLLVLDYTNPLYQQLAQRLLDQKPVNAKQLDLKDFDTNGDGILNREDLIYPYLNIIYFNGTQGYMIKSLESAKIHGLKVDGQTMAILSDGTMRYLYRINKLGGAIIVDSPTTRKVTHLPEKPIPLNP